MPARPLATGAVNHGARREALFAALDDPRRMASALPHVDGIEVTGSGGFRATIRPALALGEVPISTTWLLIERRPQERLVWEVSGRSSEYRLDMRCRVELDHSQVRWSVELASSGPMRAMSQRTLTAIVSHQARLVIEAALR